MYDDTINAADVLAELIHADDGCPHYGDDSTDSPELLGWGWTAVVGGNDYGD